MFGVSVWDSCERTIKNNIETMKSTRTKDSEQKKEHSVIRSSTRNVILPADILRLLRLRRLEFRTSRDTMAEAAAECTAAIFVAKQHHLIRQALHRGQKLGHILFRLNEQMLEIE